jgi:ATP-dependent Clp protease ATP-binding subunit ClpX
LLFKLLQAAEGDRHRLHRRGRQDQGGEFGVQHTQGTVTTVPPQGGYEHPFDFDTTNVLFICGGVFVGLEDIIARRLGKGGFDFGQLAEKYQVVDDGLLRQVKPEDLEGYGLIPEIIRLLTVIAPLDDLGVDDFFRF